MRILYSETSAFLPSSAHFLEALDARARAGHGEFLFFDEARFIAPRGSIADRVARRVVGRPLRGYGEINRALLAAAESFRPDLILIAKGAYFTAATLRTLKASSAAMLVNYSSDDPFNPAGSSRDVLESIPLFDLYLSTRRAAMPDIARAGCPRVEYLMFGYKPELHFPEAPRTAEEHSRFDSDVVFIGGCDADRAPYFEHLARAIPGLRMHLYGGYFDRYPALKPYWRGMATGHDYRLAVGGAKIAVNLVRRANRDDHVMRTFEIPVCGAFMLAERTPVHEELFEENREAAFFSSPAELTESVREWLGRDADRARVAAAAHRKIASGGHRYADRLARIVELTCNFTGNAVRPYQPSSPPTFRPV
jgi:hypothetical protein